MTAINTNSRSSSSVSSREPREYILQRVMFWKAADANEMKRGHDMHRYLHKECQRLYELDYTCAVIDNTAGRYCSSYPDTLYIPVASVEEKCHVQKVFVRFLCFIRLESVRSKLTLT